ncbi:hypothetical protein GCM10019059_32390 [Camelimonas fluminis]|uniref:Transcription termination/antitermination protein NusG n=1 Tax=Camelimonas fluminis TaxID=1576911 RepID=A0ABV7UI48_9HYPH|nr:transcription termination/antitermination NusG family protein [Camelimonas fluminis]GHE70097.1 hypothetical protein GCM10019059_32390 [Camelimonas fluminis]
MTSQTEKRVAEAQQARRNARHHVVRYPTAQPTANRLLESVKGLQWYALRVAPQKEFAAQEILSRKGVTTYCPSDRRWRRPNRYVRAKELRDFPLVPGYVFAGFPPGTPLWFDLFSINIIVGCVGINGEPRQVRGDAMERMISKFRNGLTRPDAEQFMQTHAEFEVGQTVVISTGPFDGMEVPVVGIVGPNAKVLIQLFNSTMEVEFPANILRPAA